MVMQEPRVKFMLKKILIAMDSVNYQHIEEEYFLYKGILLIFLMIKTKNAKSI
jgi:hypothetical protein